MKKIFMLGAFSILCSMKAQQNTGRVGINTNTPNATLEVAGNGTNATITDGFIPPKLTGAQLKDKDALYTRNQIGAVVYITQGLATNMTSAKTINITSKGFYYFDGNIWQKINADTNIYTNDGTLPANREVNLNNKRLHIKGNGILVVGGNDNTTNVNTRANLNVMGSANINNDIYAPNLPNGTNTDNVLVIGNDNKIKKINANSLNTDTNIYTNNGTLAGNRIVTMGSNTLSFSGNTTNFIKNGESVSIKPSTAGQSNFIGFYKDGANSNTRTAYIGYGANGNNNFTISNDSQNGNITLKSNSEVTGTLQVDNIPVGEIDHKMLVADNNGVIKYVSIEKAKDEINKVNVQAMPRGTILDLSKTKSEDLKEIYFADTGTIIFPNCNNDYNGKTISIYIWGGPDGTLTITTNSRQNFGGIYNPASTFKFSNPSGITYSNNSIHFDKTNHNIRIAFRAINFYCIDGDRPNWFPDLKL